MRAAGAVAFLRTEREGNHGAIILVLPPSHSRESAALERRTLGVPVRYREEPPLLQKFRAARAANKAPAATPPVTTPAPAPASAAPVTVDSLGQQLREVLADYLPTPKNGLVTSFLPDHGFAVGADGRFRRDLVATPPLPDEAYPVAIEVSATCTPSL